MALYGVPSHARFLCPEHCVSCVQGEEDFFANRVLFTRDGIIVAVVARGTVPEEEGPQCHLECPYEADLIIVQHLLQPLVVVDVGELGVPGPGVLPTPLCESEGQDCNEAQRICGMVATISFCIATCDRKMLDCMQLIARSVY